MKLIKQTVKKEIKKLVRTNISAERRFDYLRLDKNERLLPFNKKDLKSFKLSISDDDLMGYAEIGNTYNKLAKFLKIKVNQLLITAGSDLAIKTVFETFVDNKDSIVIQSPSYAMTEDYGKMFGSRIKRYSVNNDLTAKPSDIFNQIDKKTKLVVIENPNGFVGNMFKIYEIENIAKKLLSKNVLLLIYEVYFYIENSFFDK
jgi:histidinol-phosphate aminotransferase